MKINTIIHVTASENADREAQLDLRNSNNDPVYAKEIFYGKNEVIHPSGKN